MGIEPLSSVMAYQAQPIQQTQQLQEEKVKITEEGREAQYQNSEIQTDNRTAAVPKVEEKSKEKDTGEQGKQEAQANLNSQEQQQKYQEKVKKAVEQMNAKLYNSEAIFGIHDKTNRVVIKIVDKESKEVLKELPPEKTLDMIAKIWEMAGILVDEKR